MEGEGVEVLLYDLQTATAAYVGMVAENEMDLRLRHGNTIFFRFRPEISAMPRFSPFLTSASNLASTYVYILLGLNEVCLGLRLGKDLGLGVKMKPVFTEPARFCNSTYVIFKFVLRQVLNV